MSTEAGSGSWGPPPRPSRPPASEAMGDVAQRVQMVIEAAEQAADAIRDDARRQADGFLTEAQHRADGLTADRLRLIGSLTDQLIEHADAVRRHSEQMVAALERSVASLNEPPVPGPDDAGRAEVSQPSSSVPSPPSHTGSARSHEVRSESPPAELPVDERPPRYGASREEILLRATGLAVEGADRATIVEALRAEFGIADPGSIVDDVLEG